MVPPTCPGGTKTAHFWRMLDLHKTSQMPSKMALGSPSLAQRAESKKAKHDLQMDFIFIFSIIGEMAFFKEKNWGTCKKHRNYRQKMTPRTCLGLQPWPCLFLAESLKNWTVEGGSYLRCGKKQKQIHIFSAFLRNNLKRKCSFWTIFAFQGEESSSVPCRVHLNIRGFFCSHGNQSIWSAPWQYLFYFDTSWTLFLGVLFDNCFLYWMITDVLFLDSLLFQIEPLVWIDCPILFVWFWSEKGYVKHHCWYQRLLLLSHKGRSWN